MNQQRTPSKRSAFTLMEMMIVIVIIALVAGLVFPMLSKLSRSGRAEAGINTVAVAVKAARGLATRTKAPLPPPYDTANYDGVAILFTPAGEMRLVEDDRRAWDAATPSALVEASSVNAYTDVLDRDYIQLPKGSGVVGIMKNDFTNPRLLPPPFAVRIDKHGRMLGGSASTARNRLVFYDSNHDDQYRITGVADGAHRDNPYGPGAYDPQLWDPDSDVFDPSANPETAWDEDRQKWPLPFELIETVVGVIVYSKYDFDKAGKTMPDKVDNFSAGSVGEWLLENGQAVFFSRYTGAMITKGE